MHDRTEGVSSVPDPEDESLGPAMKALSPPQRRFALAAVMFPLAKDWQIAKAAGYSDFSHGSLRVAAHRNFHDVKVLAAIRECADREVRAGAMLGIATIKKIARAEGHKDQLKAAVWLAGLNDFTVEQKINVNQTVTDRSGVEILRRIREMSTQLGLDPGKLLGVNSVVDGEFTEVGGD